VLSYLSANTYATQSYVGTQIANLVASSPAALDTLNELAAALGNDPSFATTISTALGNRLRVDINTQGLSATQQGYGRTNLGLGTAATSNTGDFVAYRTFGTAANSAVGDFVAYRTFGTAANNNTGDFALASHTHSIADVTGLQTALDGKQASGSYAAATHSHIISDVTGLQTALDGKQASLGFTPYNSTNPSGYITSAALSSYVPTSGYAFGTAFTLGTMYVGTGEQFTPSFLLGVYSNGYAYKFPVAGIQSWLGLGSLAYSSATIPTNNNQLTNGAGYITSSGNISGYAMSLNGYVGQTEYIILTGPANGPVIKVRYDGATANRYIDIGSKDGNGVYSEGLKIYNGSALTFAGYTIYHTGNIPTWNQNTTGTAASISGYNNPTTAATPNTIAYRDASGDLTVRELVLNVAVQSFTPSSMVAIYPTTNQAVKVNAAGVQAFLGLGSLAYSSATIPTNNNQLTNGAGYITSAGNAATATTAPSGINRGDQIHGTVSVTPATSFASMPSGMSGFTDNWGAGDLPSGMGHVHGIACRHYNNTSNLWGWHMVGQYDIPGDLRVRWVNAGTWTAYYQLLSSSNYNNYSPTLTGGGASGTWGISISGNAATATAAQNATFLTQPNANWAGRIQLGGNGGGGSALIAVVQSTNGNLHMDAGSGNVMYLNYYNNGTIWLNGSTYYISSNGSQYNGNSATATSATTATTATNALGLGNSGDVSSLSSAGQVSGWDSRPGGNAAYSIGYHTGLTLHGYGGYGGVRLYSAGYPTLSSSVLRLEASDSVKTYGILYNDTSVRAPIYYDSDDTAYYLNPAGGSRLRNLYVGDSGDDWSDPGGWGTQIRFSNGPHVKFVLHARTPGIEAGMYVHTPSSVYIGSYTSHDVSLMFGGTRKMGFNASYIYTDVYLQAAGSVRAPLFYDSEDTAYYLDPNGTSNLNKLSGQTMAYNDMNPMSANSPYVARYNGSAGYRNGTMGSGQTDFNTIFSNWGSGFIDSWSSPGNAPGGSSHYVGLQGLHYSELNTNTVYGFQMACAGEADNRYFWRNSWPTKRSWVEMIHSGTIGSQSVSYATTAGSATTATTASNLAANTSPTIQVLNFTGVGTNSGNANQSYAIYQEGGSWAPPFPDLCIGFHTGIKIGAYFGYNGTRFYNNSDFATLTFSVNDGDNNTRGYYDIIAYASDRRLKHNVKPIENALSKVTSLVGMTYEWNSVGDQYGWTPSKEREAGVFAQDVKAVLPEAVKLAPFDQGHDEHGNMFSKSGENFLTVKYEKIVPLLIEAIKEQQLQIEELKNKLDNVLSSR
jgi:hypothetical protein